MNNIKIRVWDTNPLPYDKKMLYMDDMTNETIENDGSCIRKTLNLLTYTSPRYKLMQFTGFCDDAGTEIYENDIIDEKFKCVVFFKNGSYRVRGKNVAAIPLSKFLLKRHTAKVKVNVIGNTYENEYIIKEWI